MAPLKVSVKHAGKTHELYLDTDQSPAAFKDLIYQATGVPVDRMKVMAKGTVLKVCNLIYLLAFVIYAYETGRYPLEEDWTKRGAAATRLLRPSKR
jgi:hypothetical protein